MNRLTQSGTIEVGKAADLILIDGNPLERITDIKKVKWVFKDGQLYSAEALRKKVGFK